MVGSGDGGASNAGGGEKFVMAVDVGSSSIRCHIYDAQVKLRGKAQIPYRWLYPEPGLEELPPDQLLEDTMTAIKGAVADTGLQMKDISALGITTQRTTWVTWDKHTGEPLHNFISWNDNRGTPWALSMNRSMRMKVLNLVGMISHNATGSNRFCAARVLQMKPGCSLTNIMGEYSRNKKLRKAVKENRACFGTVDTWLVYQFTARKVHVTDYSEASATLMFDPYTLDWGWTLIRYVGAPRLIMPKVQGSCSVFGHTDEEFFGARIPITCLIGDQAASMYGARCFNEGDVNLTLGTGGFFDMNTGRKPHASLNGTYPVCAWHIDGELTFMAESSFPGVGTSLELAKRHGLLDSMNELHSLVTSVEDSDGIHFVAGSDGGLTMGDASSAERFIEDETSPSSSSSSTAELARNISRESREELNFDDIESTTSTSGSMAVFSQRRRAAHFLRAVVESIAFRSYRILKFMDDETSYPIGRIKVSGGVARSDFILSTLANLTGETVSRPMDYETTILGAATLTGITIGLYKKYGEDADETRAQDVFHPDPERSEAVQREFRRWQSAVFRPSSRSTVSMASASTISEASSSVASSAYAIPGDSSDGDSLAPSFVVKNEGANEDGPASLLARSVAAASL